MPNDVKLQSPEGKHPVDENLRPILVGNKLTAIETAQHGNGARVSGDLEISGSIPAVRTNTILADDDLILTGSQLVTINCNPLYIVNPDTSKLAFFLGTGDGVEPFFKIFDEEGDDFLMITFLGTKKVQISTSDDDGSDADLIFAVDGYIEMGSASGEDITLDSGDDIILDADGDQVSMKFGGATGQIDFSNENSGDGIVRQMIDAKDLVIQQFDGNEVARFTDGGDLKITNTVYFAAETANAIGDGATGAIDWNVSQKQKLTITGTGITVNFTNPAGVCNLLLKVVQGDGSDVVGTWDGDIYWAGGSAPTLSTGNGDVDILSFYWDGSRYYGIASLDFS